MHDLTPPPTPLLGRAHELETLRRLVLHPDVRLITLTGPGGVGKTRLALAAAALVAGAFVDGLAGVALAPIDDPALVLPTIMRALGSREEDLLDPQAALQGLLADRQQLLLLDNFEHVIGAASALPALLAACPDLKLLITSRELLHLRGEYEFAVPLLPAPDTARLTRLRHGQAQVVAQNPAVALFVQRATAASPRFTLDDTNALAVAQLCALLDGLPLAIELAAARIKIFSPQALLLHISGAAGAPALALLGGAVRDLPARQQTLRSTIAWSYNLLQPPEQLLLRQLAVFAGGFTPELVASLQRWFAEAAGHPAPRLPQPAAALDQLAALADKSLLQPAPGSNGPRFALLEMIRVFAAEQAEQHGETERAQRAHATILLGLAESAGPQLLAPAPPGWLAALDAEHDNLRAALRRSLDVGDSALAAALAGALWPFWLQRGHARTGAGWLEQALAVVQAAPAAHARLLLGAAYCALYLGNHRQALAQSQAALADYRQLADQVGVAWALHARVRLAMRTQRLDLLELAHARAWRCSARWASATALSRRSYTGGSRYGARGVTPRRTRRSMSR